MTAQGVVAVAGSAYREAERPGWERGIMLAAAGLCPFDEYGSGAAGVLSLNR